MQGIIKPRHDILRQYLYYARYYSDEYRLLSFSTTCFILFYYITVLYFNMKRWIVPKV
jgi:hypothetical protein